MRQVGYFKEFVTRFTSNKICCNEIHEQQNIKYLHSLLTLTNNFFLLQLM